MRTLLWFLTFATVALPAAAGGPPVLAVLETGDRSAESAPIRATAGAQASPLANRPYLLWTLREGDTLQQTQAPPERMIRFYRITGQDTQVVATFLVQYQRGEKGWRPGYALLEQPLVTWDGKQFKPVGTEEMARGLVQINNPGAPNRNGLYHRLQFGLAAVATQIDAWEVE